MPTGFHDCRRKGSENMAVQNLHFQLIYITNRPTWVQFGEVAVHFYTAPHSPIWIIFAEVYLDPRAFDYTKLDDYWVIIVNILLTIKLTPPFGVKLNLDDCASSYLSSWNFDPQQPLVLLESTILSRNWLFMSQDTAISLF